MTDDFKKHLERSSEIVASWPEWKRNCLGDLIHNESKEEIMTDDKLKRERITAIFETILPGNDLFDGQAWELYDNSGDDFETSVPFSALLVIAVRILELAEALGEIEEYELERGGDMAPLFSNGFFKLQAIARSALAQPAPEKE